MSEIKYNLVASEEFYGCVPELLKDYWSSQDVDKKKYTYNTIELSKKYSLCRYEISIEVKKQGHLETKVLMNCGECYIDVEVSSRSELANIRRKSNSQLFCEKCTKEKARFTANYFINYFNEIKPKNISFERSQPREELSYLERIFIYTIITRSGFIEKNYIDNTLWQSLKEIETGGLDNVLSSLFSKGYIYISEPFEKHQDLDMILDYIKKFKDNSIQYVNPELSEQILEISKLDFSKNVRVNIKEGYSHLDSWIKDLYSEIVNSSLTIEDCSEIEYFVMTKRFMEVYDLINYTCNEWGIPVSKDNALEFEMLRMIKNFNLNDCFSILYFKAKATAARLHQMKAERAEKYHFKKDHIFRHNISSYIDYLESKDEKPKYARALPVEWITSEVELFISMNLIKDCQKWEKLTPNEIVSKWLTGKI